MKRVDKYRKKSKFRFLKYIGISLLFVLAIIVPAFISHTIFTTKQSVDNMYNPSKAITNVNKIETLEADGSKTRIGILLIGLDNDSERGLGSTRSDSLIYLAYDGENKKINMVSLPRDIYTEIYDGDGNVVNQSKINSAYTLNEVDSTIETVANYLDLPIDYYATVNFISFKQIIDSVGGIDVNVPYDINSEYAKDNSGTLLIPEGNQHLNGEQALIFSRIRKADDDIQRGNRQQEVIKATIKSALSINSITKYQEILNAVDGNVETNLTFSNLTSLAGNMLNGFDIQSNIYDWEGGFVGEESVVYIKQESYTTIRNDMLKSLGLDANYTQKINYSY